MTRTPAELRAQILALTREYSAAVHRAHRPGRDAERAAFEPGVSTVPYAGRVFDEDEVEAAVGSVLDFWLTLGPEGEAFEKSFAQRVGVRRTLLVNSGSSANLLALSALTSHRLPEERRLRPGDEVITCAAGFPTTVAPIVQCGAVPVFLDNHPLTGNADLTLLEAALRPGRTKAFMAAHALGNPFDLTRVTEFCRRHGLWLIEDNCDALGSTYTLPGGTPRATGTFGELSTQSFYPPHHLTLGEGGAVSINGHLMLASIVESLRDWGRDCWCPSGRDNTCNKRFGWQLGDLPAGYDHKYIYSHFGYNLKPLDVQAAIGRQQLAKLDAFTASRQRNWESLRRGLAPLEEFFEFSLPTHATGWTAGQGFDWDTTGARADCSWFGFLLLVRPGAPFRRTELARALEARKIGNRNFFGGNLVRQPLFLQLRNDRGDSAYRIVSSDGKLPGADRIMNDALFLGVYPGLSPAMLDYMVESVTDFCRSRV
ncbi:MAG: lipopolysaccharide biosynthesis protein RfbH [Verrucomicrobia bacterium]|nr:lipopolysaccharide biosynthesis protein RfbH [Verrucomicrobiota bacterium]